jgi:hypothetical protein
MPFTFSPAVGESVDVLVPYTHSHTASKSIHLAFSASLSPAEFDEYRRSGTRLQLWSDLPASGLDGGTAIEWGEMEFTPGPERVPYDVSLFEREEYEGPERRLSLIVPVPLTSDGVLKYSFTYRLVYPSGEIAWLGAFGQNGSVTITVQNEATFTPSNGWKALESDDADRVWTTNGTTAEESYLINTNLSDWIVWAFGKDR